jgi:hypothetical protein
MSRALAVARVQVAAAREAEYLAGAAELAAALKARGQHFWVFRHPTRPGAFLEFREAADERALVAVAPASAEARLGDALRALASADPDADVVWREVPLAGAGASATSPA